VRRQLDGDYMYKCATLRLRCLDSAMIYASTDPMPHILSLRMMFSELSASPMSSALRTTSPPCLLRCLSVSYFCTRMHVNVCERFRPLLLCKLRKDGFACQRAVQHEQTIFSLN
jgi:hypothetical protein